MKGSTMSLALAAAFATSSTALHYEKRDNPRTIHMPIRREEATPERREEMRQRRSNRFGKRQKTVSETLDNFEDGSLYYANVTIGTPPQSLRFHLDTGSSDLWANSATSSFCMQSAQTLQAQGYESCATSGTYNANKSSTYKYINSEFYISYADTTGAAGDYVADTVRFGNTDITGQQFGVGYSSNSSQGVMGIGYPELEVQTAYNNEKPYANIPQNMANLGLINTPSYSLWLDDLQSTTGNLLFGGVDTSRFAGDLVTVPILQEKGQYLEMIVGLSGLSMESQGKNTSLLNQVIPVLLDSGSTLMYLPTSVASQIYSMVGAKYSSRAGVATCPCSLAKDTQTTIDFNFSGKTISVHMSELVLQDNASGSTCIFGVLPQGSDEGDTFTLGDTFIRNAYLVYDLDANTISLAQTNFSPGSSDVREIQKGTNGVPAASGAANPATVAVQASGSNILGGRPTALGDLTNGARPTAAPIWNAAAVVGVGAVLAAI